MERVLLSDLKNHLNQEVLIQGWVQEIRNLSKIKFLIVRDRSGDMQTVALKADTEEKSFLAIDSITKESVVEVVGIPKENRESRWGMEVLVKKLTMISLAAVPLPIDNTEKSNTIIDKRLDYRFLDTRNKKHLAIFKIRSKIVKSLIEFFDQQGFTYINTPKMTAIGVESGAQLFEIDYFGRPMYLAQSPQVYKQMFVAGGFERVCEIAPVFRAEKSHTMRHLTEFTGVDFEMGFIKDEHDVMDLIEKMVRFMIALLQKESAAELALLGAEIHLPAKIPRLTLEEAKKIVETNGRRYSPDEDLDVEGEKMLGEMILKKFSSDFVFVTHYPWAVKPFYQMKDEAKKGTTKSFDLLYRGVEIASGSQREHRSEVWRQQAIEKGLNPDEMKIYEDIFRYGCPPHGGAGFGLDRITQRLLNLDNVREAVLLPRDPERDRP